MRRINCILALAGIMTWAVLLASCSTDESVFRNDDFTKDQAQMSFADLDGDVMLVKFDHMYSSHHHGQNHEHNLQLSDIQPQWSAARKIEEAGSTIWEVPLAKGYASVIVAGRLNGELIAPVTYPTASRLLVAKDKITGNVECQVLTLVGENIEQTHINSLKNLTGYAIVSSQDGTPVRSYKVANGTLQEIVAGTAELQQQEGDFYCFCFWQEDDCEKPLTKGYKAPDYELGGKTYCSMCDKELDFCECTRCAGCNKLPPFCECYRCGVCGKTKDQCICNENCTRCYLPRWQCKCTPTTTPTICPRCNTQHTGECPSTTTPLPGPGCRYGNIYCPGGDNCRCCPICRGVCKCTVCHRDPCVCVTSTH